MRVLIDTNVLSSYLLDPTKDQKLQYIVDSGFEGIYTMILPHELFIELKEKLTVKPYLVRRIPKQIAKQFIAALSIVIEMIPSITEPIPEVSRDKKDDYLLAYASVGKANYLVSGDKDLISLEQKFPFKIIRPAIFLRKL